MNFFLNSVSKLKKNSYMVLKTSATLSKKPSKNIEIIQVLFIINQMVSESDIWFLFSFKAVEYPYSFNKLLWRSNKWAIMW